MQEAVKVISRNRFLLFNHASMNQIKLTHYLVASPKFQDVSGELQRILFATRTSQVMIVTEYAWHILTEGNFHLLSAEQIESLTAIKILVPADENELLSIVQRNKKSIEENERLYYVVQPTASCQLGCGYCGQVHSQKKLSVEHQEIISQRIRIMLMCGNYKALDIGWFGGEPLSGLSVIKDMSTKLMALANEFGCSYSAKMPTNGLQLNVETALLLYENCGFKSFEITIDGAQEYHDKRRHTKNNKPTFEKVFENLLAVARDERLKQVALIVRCNVDRANVEGVSPLIHFLAEHSLQNRVTFYVAPIHSWGNDAHLSSLSKEEFCEKELEWICELLELGFKINLIPPQKNVVCLAVNKHSELVDAYGNLFNCTEASYVPNYGSEYQFGHLNGQSELGKKNYLGNFNDEVLQGSFDCNTCEMLPVCGGSCPKEWKEGRVPCPPSKLNMKTKLLLNHAHLLQSARQVI